MAFSTKNHNIRKFESILTKTCIGLSFDENWETKVFMSLTDDRSQIWNKEEKNDCDFICIYQKKRT